MLTLCFHTFRTLMRQKIIYNVFGITVLMLFIGYLASLLVWGHQYRVMLDMGLAMNAISLFFVAIGIGARYFRNEMESKTIYLFLSRPVSRVQFFISRIAGMALFLLFNFTLLTLVLMFAVKMALGTFSGAFFQSILYTYLESLVLLSASVLFAFWFAPAIVLMVMIAMLFLGHNHELIGTMQGSIPLLNHLTPNLGIFQMTDRVYYQEMLSSGMFLNGLLYGFFWFLFFLLIGNAVFSKKNL
jgi:ABC-2 type transport system permease protein